MSELQKKNKKKSKKGVFYQKIGVFIKKHLFNQKKVFFSLKIKGRSCYNCKILTGVDRKFCFSDIGLKS
jgi:hypothetical protein